MDSASELKNLPKAWQPWRNPIFTRYRRSRLRLPAIITGALVYGGLSLFFYFVVLGISSARGAVTEEQAALAQFGVILMLQLLILNFTGTGAVASGMARESIEDMMTYQRLTPLSPVTKIIGYLSGLPVRQYYHFVATLPVTVLILSSGHVPIEVWIPVYVVLFTSTVMFYLLAMSVGLIMGKRFSALISQGLVALLYFVIPQLSKFGFVIFDYLTLRPTIITSLWPTILSSFNQRIDPQFLATSSLFFDWELPKTYYCVAMQLLLALVFFCLLYRRWKLETSHLLSKAQCIIITLLFHICILGGLWANTASGQILKMNTSSRNINVLAAESMVNQNVQIPSGFILGIYGLIGFIFALLMQYLYTPAKYSYLAGIRQRKKDKKSTLSYQGLLSDSSSAVPTSLIITTITTAAWLFYCRHLGQSAPLLGFMQGASWQPIETTIIAVAFVPLLAHALLLEKLGHKLTLFIAAFAWILPMASALLFSAWKFGGKFTGFINGLSPVAMNFSPGYVLAQTHATTKDSLFIVGTWTSIIFHATLALVLLIKLVQRHREFSKLED